MYRILKKKKLAEKIYLMDIEAPKVAAKAMPGQFVIIRIDEKGERIPLTVCDYDRAAGYITIVYQEVGYSTTRLTGLNEGDSLADFVGPLGKPSDLCELTFDELKQKKLLFVAGGVGTAPVYPQVKWLKERHIDCDVIIGARNRDLIILEDEMRALVGDEHLYVCTDDASYGMQGPVTVVIEELVKNRGKAYNHCVAIGPMIMMKFCCKTTAALDIPTVVSMNPIMVDGTGMCGACRVLVGGEVKFACVDGPEFDGHKVDFDQAMARSKAYKTEEGRAMLKLTEGATHHGNCGNCGGDK